ncbi:MAG: hypothetical protein MJ102_01410 [Clostridia bacterium]|nr:hypothetical protein [Clostridia bacterium]
MKRKIPFISFLLAVFTVLTVTISLSSVIMTAGAEDAGNDGAVLDAEAYKNVLTEAGFPEDYAEKLTVLHEQHPLWSFEPLDITGISKGQYTWSYVIHMETEDDQKRNLVENVSTYLTMRDFSNFNLYDSGWWKASAAAVEYMMDPRNFLDEKQIFQFYDLAWSESVTLEAVEAALKGTFMENAKLDGKYSDMTYAEYFMLIGKELGASPVYLAARVRNEQGVAGTSPLISGACGDKLWYYYSNKITDSENGKLIKAPVSGHTEDSLKAYNGLYNYFNIGAAGTGYFSIYLGGMKEALKGTAQKADEWGDSGAWNTRWKALYGGAYSATEKYIKDYQNTSYLQKFNVDARSARNFWGQYMQSIHGAYSAASTFYKSFKENNMLDLPYTFLIPVYEGMPDKCPCPDGTEFTDKSKLSSSTIQSYDMVDMESLIGSGVSKNFSAGEITWRVFVGSTGKYLDLGQMDLTQYSMAFIEYSVSKSFNNFECGKRSVIGFVGLSDHLYGGEGSEIDEYADLGNAVMVNGKDGYLARKTAVVNLRNTAYNGHVFLNAYTQKGQKYVVHNIIFVKNNAYDSTLATEPGYLTETVVPGTDTVPESETEIIESGNITEENEENEGKGCGAALAIPAVFAAASLTAVILPRRRKD